VNTGNEQEIGNVAGLDWLAGITDGEGCIALMVFKGGARHATYHGFRLQMRVTIANTNDGIVDRIVSILTQCGIGHHIQVQASKTKGRETGKMSRLVHVSTKTNVLRLLEILLPRLADTDKKERARLLVQLIRQRDEFAQVHKIRATHSYTQADVDVIMEFLRLTRSKQIDNLAAILNDCTREARKTVTKKSRARHDTVWPAARAVEASEMIARQAG
jgi:hypothetical protein